MGRWRMAMLVFSPASIQTQLRVRAGPSDLQRLPCQDRQSNNVYVSSAPLPLASSCPDIGKRPGSCAAVGAVKLAFLPVLAPDEPGLFGGPAPSFYRNMTFSSSLSSMNRTGSSPCPRSVTRSSRIAPADKAGHNKIRSPSSSPQ